MKIVIDVLNETSYTTLVYTEKVLCVRRFCFRRLCASVIFFLDEIFGFLVYYGLVLIQKVLML